MTPTMYRVLVRAMAREGGYVCPTPRLKGAAQDVVIRALQTRGWVTMEPAPVITAAGREAVATKVTADVRG